MSNLEHSSLDIRLKKFDRVYRPNDRVEGTILVNAYKGWPHQGIKMTVEGKVYLNAAARGVGIFDSMNQALNKPLTLLKEEFEVTGPGKFNDGQAEVPFDFVLSGNGNSLVDSYHGVYVSVIYSIQITCDRGVMKKALFREMEFIVEIPSSRAPESTPLPFNITPESLENVNRNELAEIPKFKITGKLHRTSCPISLPFTGEVCIEVCDAPIRTIELQLVRVESINSGNLAITREATEVQTIQIGEGNVSRNMVIPMYMVFPRLYSCPTTMTSTFKIEFEINLIVVFGEGYMVTENFPITLIREN